MDLRVEVDRLGVRRLWALVNGLPRDAAVWREETQWSWERELAAALIEVHDMWGRNLALLSGAKKKSLPKPIRVPRPGREHEARGRRMTVAEFAAKYKRERR